MFASEKIIKNFDASFYEFDVANNFFDAANIINAICQQVPPRTMTYACIFSKLYRYVPAGRSYDRIIN